MRIALLALVLSCGTSSTPQPLAAKLRVSAADGLDLLQAPGAGETAVSGLVAVSTTSATGGDVPVQGATVRINGVVLPEQTPGLYDARDLAIAPGDTLSLLAVKDPDSASVTFKCPDAVSLDAPADNAQVTAGQALQASWTGRIAYSAGLFQPQLFLRAWDPTSDAVGAAYDPVQLSPTQTSASVTVPSDGKPGYILELKVPGEYADQSSTGGSGLCIIHRRVHLKVR
jgi:hypothetical protein